jgi:glycosyltransferase involved in cell wall biosynthesis
MIVVDDASTDRTGELAQRSAAGDARIEVWWNDVNVGAATSMNLAWRRSRSPYVAILDADDAALPIRFSAPLAYLQANPSITVLGGAAHFVDATGRTLRTVQMPLTHAELEQRRWYSSPFIHPSVTLRREFLETCGGYADGLRLGEDYDLWMRGFQCGRFQYANLAESLVVYTAKPVQRWAMIRASARVRLRAGRRERRWWRSHWAACRILAEGAIEQTGLFAWRDRRRSAGTLGGEE